VVLLWAASNAPAVTDSGYLTAPGASSTFAVNAGGVTDTEVPFAHPKGRVDFRVKVVEQDGRELGDFDFNNGNTVKLSGGDTFPLTISSRSRAGNWSSP
jgi:hypothetical protein